MMAARRGESIFFGICGPRAATHAPVNGPPPMHKLAGLSGILSPL